MKEFEAVEFDDNVLILKCRKDVEEVVKMLRMEDNFILVFDNGGCEYVNSSGLNTKFINGELKIRSEK
jgi:hypothetical protein